MRPPGSLSRRVLLIAAAALGLHALRAAAGWGAHAHGELDAAHGYISTATLVLVLLGVVLIAHFLFRLGVAPRSGFDSRSPQREIVGSWVSTSVILAGVCFGQELLEHVWVAGGLPGPDVAFASGGWTAVPLAALLAAAVTLTARGSDAALSTLSSAGLRGLWRSLESSVGCRPAGAHPRRDRPLARLAAGRAPPAAPFPR